MPSAITLSTFQARANNIVNVADSTPIYSTASGWSFKNSSGTSVISATDAGAVAFPINTTHKFGSTSTSGSTALEVLGGTGASDVELKLQTAGNAGRANGIKLLCANNYSWWIVANQTRSNSLEIYPSTASGGSTFSSKVIDITETGAVTFPVNTTHKFGSTSTSGSTALEVLGGTEASDVELKLQTAGNAGRTNGIKLLCANNYSWWIVANQTRSNSLEIYPSTASGGSTFSSKVIDIRETGAVTLGPSSSVGLTHTIYGAINQQLTSTIVHTVPSFSNENCYIVYDITAIGTSAELLFTWTANGSLSIRTPNAQAGRDAFSSSITLELMSGQPADYAQCPLNVYIYRYSDGNAYSANDKCYLVINVSPGKFNNTNNDYQMQLIRGVAPTYIGRYTSTGSIPAPSGTSLLDTYAMLATSFANGYVLGTHCKYEMAHAWKTPYGGHNTSGAWSFPQVYFTAVGGTNRDLYIDSTGLIGYVSSSIRYKENLREIPSVLANLNKLRLCKFDYKDQTKGVNKIGVIAEDFEDWIPEILSYDEEDNIETVQYSSLGVLALQGIKEQQQIIETLQAEIAALKEKLGE